MSSIVVRAACDRHRRPRRHRARQRARRRHDGRITAVGAGPAPRLTGARRVDGPAAWPRRASSTPTTTSTSGSPAATRRTAPCSSWLTALYPVWAQHRRGDVEDAAAGAGLGCARAVRCTTDDRPPLRLPACRRRRARRRDRRGAARSGCASTRPAARWTSAQSRAGCRRTRSSRTRRDPGRHARRRSTRYHDPSPDSMLQIGVAPCSPFSVTGDLMRESRRARPAQRGVRLHTHLAETLRRGGVLPASSSAHARSTTSSRSAGSATTSGSRTCVHLADGDIARFAATGTGVAHCPTLQRPARAPASPGSPTCSPPACRSGSASTASASNEHGAAGRGAAPGAARSPGPAAVRRRSAPGRRCAMATMGGARVPRPAGRARLAGGRQARRPRAVAARRPRPCRHRRPGLRAGFRPAGAAGLLLGRHRGGRRAGGCARPTSELARPTARPPAELARRRRRQANPLGRAG